MKNLVLFPIIFVLGLVLGKFHSEPVEQTVYKNEHLAVDNQDCENSVVDLKIIKKDSKQNDAVELAGSPQQEESNDSKSNIRYSRGQQSPSELEMTRLYKELYSAFLEGDVDAQNSSLEEMIKIDPYHEKVFWVKIGFSEQDGDFQEAYGLLQSCVDRYPGSVFCHQKLSNSRIGSTEDNIKHAKACLKLNENEAGCLAGLAMALRKKGLFSDAKIYYEKLLALSNSMNNNQKRHVLFYYAKTLEDLDFINEALNAYRQSCDLKLKAACTELDKV